MRVIVMLSLERFKKMPDASEARIGVFLLALCLAIFLLGFIFGKKVPTIRDISLLQKTPISLKEIEHGDQSKKQIIFTFDGGAGAQSSSQILDVLAKHHVKGTFFLTGKFVENYPKIVEKIAIGGNEIFSHTYDHPHLTTMSDGAISDELVKMENVLESTVGTSPKPYFRAPYGDRDRRVLVQAFADGYESVYWTVDALDWREPDGETASEVRNRILDNLAPGNIYLMHLGDSITGSILDNVFTEIEKRGYKIVSLTQGL